MYVSEPTLWGASPKSVQRSPNWRVVEMAQALDMPDEEAYVLSRVVAAHVEAERFELALSTVRNIPASPWRGTAMSSIARGYVYIGRCSDAIDLALEDGGPAREG